MSPDRAQAVVLHDVNGMDLRELATVLGITVAAAQSRLSRGRAELSRRMPDLEWGEP
jgi:DNA-directed RNA polymerase specialized sigma24 family protein